MNDLVLDILGLWMGGKEEGCVSGFCIRHCWLGCEQGDHIVVGQ